MTLFQRRLVILIDEWLGILLCCWCYHYHRETFWPVFSAFVISVYLIAYGTFWWKHDRWYR